MTLTATIDHPPVPHAPSRRVRVWDLPTRLFHWSLTGAIVGRLFTLKPGEAVAFSDGGRHGVIRLANIADADPAANKEQRDRLIADSRAQMIGDIADQFGQALHATIPVDIDQALMETLR